ncbi:MAG TPA: hypothetical protein VE987_16015 [Polyangiaceae bacterium]|nr:hypothetical protein [Polyangiaceae bacterium]
MSIGRTCVAFAAAAALAACTSTVSSPPPSGNIIMDWTVDNTKDPAQCDASGATTFNVTLNGSNGGFAGQWVQDCRAFATTIFGLIPDQYTGTANLLDRSGAPRTTSVQLAPFVVFAGTTSTVAIDFPASSFYSKPITPAAVAGGQQQ